LSFVNLFIFLSLQDLFLFLFDPSCLLKDCECSGLFLLILICLIILYDLFIFLLYELLFLLLNYFLLILLHCFKCLLLLFHLVLVHCARLHLIIWHRWSSMSCRSCGHSFLIDKFGVQKHKSLVHHLQWACHTFIIVAKFIQNFLSPSLRKFNQERFWRFDIVSSDEEVSVIWWDLHDVITLSKLFTFFV